MQRTFSHHSKSFVDSIKEIFHLKAVPQLLFMTICLSIGIGALSGISPAVTADRYARLHHGYSGPPCSKVVSDIIPAECTLGSADAQHAASISAFVKFIMTFVTGPLQGSLSDTYGRKPFIYCGIAFFNMVPIVLLILIIFPDVDPSVYYIVNTFQGLAGWFTPSFAIISDVAPESIRTFSLGVLIVTAEAGIPLVPVISSLFGYMIGTAVSLVFCAAGMIVAIYVLPETLSHEKKENALKKREEERKNGFNIMSACLRPLNDLRIINRNVCLRLIAVLYVMAEMMKSGERAVYLFYAQGQLGFNDHDTSVYVFVHMVAGISTQAFLLNFLVQRYGERKVLIISMIFGILFSFLYGIATSKTLIYLITFIESAAGMAFATVSSIMTFNVEKHELGTIQGALTSLQAVADGFGPLVLNYIFEKTENGAFLGAGSFFFVASFVYMISTLFAIALPPDQSNSERFKSDPNSASLLNEDFEELE